MDVTTSSLSSLFSSTFSSGAIENFQHAYLWAVIAGFVLAFFVGFGMGSNDVSNTFGTSIGSKVLTHKQAYILATFLTIAGAILVGYNVTDTLRNQVIDIEVYRDKPGELMIGQVAVLGAVSIWLIATTLFELPVSSTHAIVGAMIGFSVSRKGWSGIHWETITKILISWIISPVVSAFVSITLYMIIDFLVLRRKHPLRCGLRFLPILYFCVITFLTFTVTFQGSAILHLNNVPWWIAALISIACGLIAAIIVHFIVKPFLIKWIKVRENKSDPNFNMSTVMDLNTKQEKSADEIPYYTQPKFKASCCGVIKWFFPAKNRVEDKEVIYMFSALQVFTACFGAFSFGANDISHVISPITVLFSIYRTMNVEQNDPTPLYMYFYGSLAITVGLWCLGHKLIRTIGKKMTKVNPCNGFTIEFGMALTVLILSKAGIPVSTTQCIVGSVAGVGLVKSGEDLRWKVVLTTVLSWVLTMPLSGLLTAGIMFCLKFLIK